jgi:hypothetical protein
VSFVSTANASEMTPERFLANFAYSGKPLVVTNMTGEWRATAAFDFEFFRDLYRDLDSPVLDNVEEDCQFFSWDFSEFNNMDVGTASFFPKKPSASMPMFFSFSPTSGGVLDARRALSDDGQLLPVVRGLGGLRSRGERVPPRLLPEALLLARQVRIGKKRLVFHRVIARFQNIHSK